MGVIKKVGNCLDNKLALTLYIIFGIGRVPRNEHERHVVFVDELGASRKLLARTYSLTLDKRREPHRSLLCHKNVYPKGEQGDQ